MQLTSCVFMCTCLWTHWSHVLIQTIWTSVYWVLYVFSLSLFLCTPHLCSLLSLIPLGSTSKNRPKICLGGTLLVVVVKKKDGVFAVIVNACVQPQLGKETEKRKEYLAVSPGACSFPAAQQLICPFQRGALLGVVIFPLPSTFLKYLLTSIQVSPA